jgi:hypothetical protein
MEILLGQPRVKALDVYYGVNSFSAERVLISFVKKLCPQLKASVEKNGIGNIDFFKVSDSALLMIPTLFKDQVLVSIPESNFEETLSRTAACVLLNIMTADLLASKQNYCPKSSIQSQSLSAYVAQLSDNEQSLVNRALLPA